jgi:dTDP-4-amino-4,6-dideoxygalactose transaminase
MSVTQSLRIIGERDFERVVQSLAHGDLQPSSTSLSSPNADVDNNRVWQREILSAEAAALASEFATVHAPSAIPQLTVVPVSNGTRAITLALTAVAARATRLGLREPRVGDNVIVPSLTWSATATAALERGFVPRLADIDPQTMTVDPASVRRLIDDRTFAIIAVHLYNRMADVLTLRNIADEYGLALVEDCAHAHGASLGGVPAGMTGHVGTFSLQASKTLTAGEGGLVVSTDTELMYQVASLANCGRPCQTALPLPAGNDRLPVLSAALARSQLERFEERHAARVSLWEELDTVAEGLPGVRPFTRQDGVPPTYKWVARYQQSSVNDLASELSDILNVEVGRTYLPLHMNPGYRPDLDPLMGPYVLEDRARYLAAYPGAEEVYGTALTIAHGAAADLRFAGRYQSAIQNL